MTMLCAIRHTLPLAAVAALMLAKPASAQDYPTRNINVLVGFAAGGAADVIARQVGQRLGERLGQTVVVENRGGAGGSIAGKMVSNAAPDGYTLLTMTSSLAISETASKNKGFSVDDLRTVAIVAYSPYVIAVHPSNPAKDLKEFVANGREKSFTFGSPGVGTGPHIGAEYFFREVAKLKAVHVPFGNARAEVALLGGHVDALVIFSGRDDGDQSESGARDRARERDTQSGSAAGADTGRGRLPPMSITARGSDSSRQPRRPTPRLPG